MTHPADDRERSRGPGGATGSAGEPGAEWTVGYGGPDNAWNFTILPRIRAFMPCEHCLEIGPGMGVWTARLRPLARRMTLVDPAATCIEACRVRFGGRRMKYVVGDGGALQALAADSVDFVFSWHALVHAEREEIRGYLRELLRLMKPGATGLVHHSNFGELVDPVTGVPRVPNHHQRALTVSAGVFREECGAAGLCCTYQEIVPWGSAHRTDCFSVFTRLAAGARVETVVEENDGFWHRVQDATRVANRYAHPFPELKPRARRMIFGIQIG